MSCKYITIFVLTGFLCELRSQPDLEKIYSYFVQHYSDARVPIAFVRKSFFDSCTAIDTGTLKHLGSRWSFFHDKHFYDVLSRGKVFMRDWAPVLAQVQEKYHVPASLICAIIGTETNYGAYCGKHDIFNVFYTCLSQIPARVVWAARELRAYLCYCFERGLDPHAIKGSYCGAFGYGQFLPRSFVFYGIDFDGADRARHDNWPDVIASVANYLAKNGFKIHESSFEPGSANWRAIFAYNHSRAYVERVLEIMRALPFNILIL